MSTDPSTDTVEQERLAAASRTQGLVFAGFVVGAFVVVSIVVLATNRWDKNSWDGITAVATVVQTLAVIVGLIEIPIQIRAGRDENRRHRMVTMWEQVRRELTETFSPQLDAYLEELRRYAELAGDPRTEWQASTSVAKRSVGVLSAQLDRAAVSLSMQLHLVGAKAPDELDEIKRLVSGAGGFSSVAERIATIRAASSALNLTVEQLLVDSIGTGMRVR